MRSKDFKRTPFTDWLDNIESVCNQCGTKAHLTDSLCHGCRVSMGYENEEEK